MNVSMSRLKAMGNDLEITVREQIAKELEGRASFWIAESDDEDDPSCSSKLYARGCAFRDAAMVARFGVGMVG